MKLPAQVLGHQRFGDRVAVFRERALQGFDRGRCADEHDPLPDPEPALERREGRTVRPPQRSDKDRGQDDGGRDDPVRVEVESRPECEGKRQHAHQNHGRRDSLNAGTAIARRVETGLREDQDDDEAEEAEPVRGRFPQPLPVRSCPDPELAQDEGEVHPCCKPHEVDRHQREHSDGLRHGIGDSSRQGGRAERAA